MSYPDFSPVDEFAFTYGLDMDHDLAPTHCLGDISISFDSAFCSEYTSVSYTSDCPTMDYQESVGLMPHDSMEETPQPGGILAPLVADYVPAPADRPFDGEICTQDTYLKDIKRFMDKHGKAPHFDAFSQESFPVRRGRVSSKPKNVSFNIPTTPVRKQVAPLPKRTRKAVGSSSATVSDTPDHTPKRTLRQRKDVTLR